MKQKSLILFAILVVAAAALYRWSGRHVELTVTDDTENVEAAGPTGVWTDPATRLMWQARDNGYDIDQKDSKIFCTNTRVGGFSDWRVPTIDELKSVYYIGDNDYGYRIKGNIKLTGLYQWSSEAGLDLYFHSGESNQYRYYDGRVLCVRPAGK